MGRKVISNYSVDAPLPAFGFLPPSLTLLIAKQLTLGSEPSLSQNTVSEDPGMFLLAFSPFPGVLDAQYMESKGRNAQWQAEFMYR